MLKRRQTRRSPRVFRHHRRRFDDRGSVLVVAVAIAFVVVALGTAAISQTIDGVNQSGIANRQVVTTDSAEAGLQYEINQVSVAAATVPAPSSFLCPYGTQTLNSGSATYSVAYSSTPNLGTATSPTVPGTPVACPSSGVATLSASTSYLFQVSGRTPSGLFGSSTDQALVVTSAAGSSGSPFDQAVFGNSGLNFETFSIRGTGGIYTNGPWACTNETTTAANVTVNGSSTSLDNSCNIAGNLWSKGPITMNTSSVSGWTETAGNLATQNVNNTSGAEYSGSYSYVNRTCVQAFSSCAAYGATGMPAAPATETYPTVNYGTAWAAAGWTPVVETTCLAYPVDILLAAISGKNTVIVVPSGCGAIPVPGFTLSDSLAIISPGGFSSQNGFTIGSDGNHHTLDLIVPSSTSASCGTSSAPTFYFQGQPTFVSTIATLFFTPCDITLANGLGGSGLTGEIYAGGTFNVDASGGALTYSQITVPGATGGVASVGAETASTVYVKRIGG